MIQRFVRIHHRSRINVFCLSAGIPDDLISLLFVCAFCLIPALFRELILLHDLINTGIQAIDQAKHFLLVDNDPVVIIYLAPGNKHVNIPQYFL